MAPLTNQLGYVCSVPVSDTWSSIGKYPNVDNLECPSGYQPYHSGCYKVFSAARGWDDANQYCVEQGQTTNWNGAANLVTIWNEGLGFPSLNIVYWKLSCRHPSKGEDNFFYSLLYEGFYNHIDSDSSIHIGLKIESAQTDLSERIEWIDNFTVSWTNWGPHQPAINQGTNCGFIDKILAYPKDWGWSLSNNCDTPS